MRQQNWYRLGAIRLFWVLNKKIFITKKSYQQMLDEIILFLFLHL